MAAVGAKAAILVVGLGNHGLSTTRHNVGMMALDAVVRGMRTAKGWEMQSKVGGYVTESLVQVAPPPQAQSTVPNSSALAAASSTQRVIFLKPKGFMNHSGLIVLQALKYYSLPSSRLVVVHDDLQRKLANVATKAGGSANGHNGLKSIIASLKTSDFRRLRIGIGRPASKMHADVAKYVLQKFSQEELAQLESDAWPSVSKALTTLITEIGP
ncbi:peptidyl-tRNA hydrolase [Gaertneriomyces semiglobifer]|nr:peptidyl-tRNA hydrolase [Gaertneriomyces semiglobifer]